MVWLSHQRFGVDRSGKHGISVRNTSRLGGLAITLFLLALEGSSYLSQELGFDLNLIVALPAASGLLVGLAINWDDWTC